MSFLYNRRSFVSGLASFVGLAAVQSTSEAAAQAPARPAGNWDLAWLDELRGQHKQVYDLGSVEPTVEPNVLRFTRNFLDTFREVYGLEFPDVNTAIGISSRALPMNASDAIWEKYRFGEVYKIVDPVTKRPALRNVFLSDGALNVKALQARGTVFWQCNVALGGAARRLAAATDTPFEEVRAELIAGLNPGVRLVPSHVMALALVQERGFSYMRP